MTYLCRLWNAIESKIYKNGNTIAHNTYAQCACTTQFYKQKKYIK